MNIFSTVSVPMYFVCASLEEQVGHATQAEFFKQADFLVSNHDRHVTGMAMTYKHTNTLRRND